MQNVRIRFRNGPALTIKNITKYGAEESMFYTANGKVLINMSDVLYVDFDTAGNDKSNSELVSEDTPPDEETKGE